MSEETKFSLVKVLSRIHEGLDFDIAGRYANNLNLMWTVAFYAPMIPISLVWTLLTLVVTYWMEKVFL